MELMTKEISEKLPKLYSTQSIPSEEKTIIVKYFSPYNGWTWYGCEYDPEYKIFFGYIEGHFGEWGEFSLKEFEEVNRLKGFPFIERDLYFKPKKVKELFL